MASTSTSTATKSTKSSTTQTTTKATRQPSRMATFIERFTEAADLDLPPKEVSALVDKFMTTLVDVVLQSEEPLTFKNFMSFRRVLRQERSYTPPVKHGKDGQPDSVPEPFKKQAHFALTMSVMPQAKKKFEGISVIKEGPVDVSGGDDGEATEGIEGEGDGVEEKEKKEKVVKSKAKVKDAEAPKVKAVKKPSSPKPKKVDEAQLAAESPVASAAPEVTSAVESDEE